MSKETEHLKKITNTLLKKIERQYAKESEQTNKIIDDRMAIRVLNSLETEQIRDEEAVRRFIELAERFLK